jgi:hypothetical protein
MADRDNRRTDFMPVGMQCVAACMLSEEVENENACSSANERKFLTLNPINMLLLR